MIFRRKIIIKGTDYDEYLFNDIIEYQKKNIQNINNIFELNKTEQENSILIKDILDNDIEFTNIFKTKMNDLFDDELLQRNQNVIIVA